MPSTFLSLHYHIIFSTKNRELLILPLWRGRLYEYMVGTALHLGAQCQMVGGTADHVHVLVELRATHVLSDFMRELKKGSSMWVRETIPNPTFAWQEGYAAFTVSASGVDKVRRYIENQEAHHRKQSFREELVYMLRHSGVKYDERYVD